MTNDILSIVDEALAEDGIICMTPTDDKNTRWLEIESKGIRLKFAIGTIYDKYVMIWSHCFPLKKDSPNLFQILKVIMKINRYLGTGNYLWNEQYEDIRFEYVVSARLMSKYDFLDMFHTFSTAAFYFYPTLGRACGINITDD